MTKTSEWPASVLSHTRALSMKCNPVQVSLYLRRNGAKLVTMNTARLGAPESIESSHDWGLVLAYTLALIQLGVQPDAVLEALRGLVPQKDETP